MNAFSRLFRLLLVLAVMLPASLAWGQNREVILDFDVLIVVGADSEITVSETIKVRATGNEIKRGIYRQLPVVTSDREGNTLYTDYRILGVTRNGKTITHFSETKGKSIRHYLGDRDVRIKPGVYTYVLKYRVAGQIGYFDDVDEIYWNATGSDWAFPILGATATVVLPPGATASQAAAYTGRRGESGNNFTITDEGAGRVTFRTTATLNRGEGLTVAVGWPKGIVFEPSPEQKTAAGIRHNLHWVIGFVGMLVILAYYLFVWDRVGRDPVGGTIIPLFEPPEDYSPALMHTLLKMGFSDKAFAAVIVSLAVKGMIEIQDTSGGFSLLKVSDDTSMLTPGEKAVFRALLGSRSYILLDQVNHTHIGAAQSALKDYLERELETSHYKTNIPYLIPGAVLSVLSVAALVMSIPGVDIEGAVFLSVWLTVWTVACVFLVRTAIKAWRQFGSGFKHAYRAIVFSIMSISFISGEGMGATLLIEASSIFVLIYLLIVAALFYLFYVLIKAPTVMGRKVMDAIEGFKLYLSTAEQHVLEAMHPPDETPELFEKYLPYALALDVENQWSERFAGVLARAGQDGYQPRWYSGGNFHTHGVAGMCSSLSGGLSGALGASASAPGSSGGGGSGGGGGGGGGF